MTSPPTQLWTEHARQFAVTSDHRCLEIAAASCVDQDIVTFLLLQRHLTVLRPKTCVLDTDNVLAGPLKGLNGVVVLGQWAG